MDASSQRSANRNDPQTPVFAGEEGARQAAELLAAGFLVALPTETVYGLGADAKNASAVARVFEVKRRPSFDPLIVHVASLDAAEQVAAFTPVARKLAEAFWPGPLTLVLTRDPAIPELVSAGHASIGVRVPDHPLTLLCLREVARPIAAPSANPFGYISPTSAEHVLQQLGGMIDGVLDGGPCRVGVESTVVRVRADDQLEILRPGGLAREELESVAGAHVVTHGVPLHEEASGAKLAPGRSKSHYAPSCPLMLVPSLESLPEPGEEAEDAGLLAFRTPPPAWEQGFRSVEVLSPSGDLREAAANLFGAMRRLDRAGLRQIVAERAPNKGLGAAINDRLERASAR